MIWTAAAIHELPVALLDGVFTIFLFHLARVAEKRGDDDATVRSTRMLALWFLPLTFLSTAHVVSCTVLVPRVSFIANTVVESCSVIASVIPLNAFAYSYDPIERPRERRFVLMALTALAAVICAHYAWRGVLLPDDKLFFRVDVEHTEATDDHALGGLSLSLFVFAGYTLACTKFLRQALRTKAAGAFAFAGVVAAAVVAVVINRLEAAALVPLGAYTTWMLVTMLVAVVVFMSHSERITSFPERIVGITLALVLIVLAGAGQIAVRMRMDREDAVRAALMDRARELWGEGKRDEALRVTGALSARVLTHDEVAIDDARTPPTIDDVTIDEDFPAPSASGASGASGDVVRFAFSYVERARIVDRVASRVAIGLVAATLLCSLFLRRLFENSVLVPLRVLERADASSRAKTMFIAQLSHELRTPLSAVVGHARNLETSAGADHDRHRARDIGEAAEHLLALVEGLIEEGKADLSNVVARNEEIALRPLVRAVLDLARPRVQPGVALLDEIDDALPASVDTDPRLLRQVLLNLVTNAAKNTAHGSIVCRVQPSEAGVRFIVDDTGRGIPRDQMGRIFQAFHQVKRDDGSVVDGAGLGLTIAQRFAEALKTSIHVESELGAGARFSFDLPLENARASTSRTSAAHIVLPGGAVRAELRELALVGDVVALKERAHALAAADARYTPFAARVDALVDSYQVRALQALFDEPRSTSREDEPR